MRDLKCSTTGGELTAVKIPMCTRQNVTSMVICLPLSLPASTLHLPNFYISQSESLHCLHRSNFTQHQTPFQLRCSKYRTLSEAVKVQVVRYTCTCLINTNAACVMSRSLDACSSSFHDIHEHRQGLGKSILFHIRFQTHMHLKKINYYHIPLNYRLTLIEIK